MSKTTPTSLPDRVFYAFKLVLTHPLIFIPIPVCLALLTLILTLGIETYLMPVNGSFQIELDPNQKGEIARIFLSHTSFLEYFGTLFVKPILLFFSFLTIAYTSFAVVQIHQKKEIHFGEIFQAFLQKTNVIFSLFIAFILFYCIPIILFISRMLVAIHVYGDAYEAKNLGKLIELYKENTGANFIIGAATFVAGIFALIKGTQAFAAWFTTFEENHEGKDAIQRSAALVRGKWWRTFGNIFLILFFLILCLLALDTVLSMISPPYKEALIETFLSESFSTAHFGIVIGFYIVTSIFGSIVTVFSYTLYRNYREEGELDENEAKVDKRTKKNDNDDLF